LTRTTAAHKSSRGQALLANNSEGVDGLKRRFGSNAAETIFRGRAPSDAVLCTSDMERYHSRNGPCDYVPGISGYGRICDGALAQRYCFSGFLAERQSVELRVKIHNQRVPRLKLCSS
jgi:hypothetical protein